jgi:acetyl-CoA acetyltransferase
MPYGSPLVSGYALAARRHMHQYGTTSEQLARVAVDMRANAAKNPLAMYRDPLTVDDVLASRMISDPLHMLDCCIISDGGGAVLMTTAERARDLRQTPIYVRGSATAQTHWNISAMPDFTVTAAAQSGPAAFQKAGITPADVDMLMLYDSFTITVLLLLEDLGFAKKGEGGPFLDANRLTYDGDLPTNTDGGGLSSCHPGMRGIFLLIESVRQLRGQAGAVQVPDAEIAVACGSGGQLSCMGTVVLGKEKP